MSKTGGKNSSRWVCGLKKRIQQRWIPHVAQVRQAEFDQFDQKRQHLGRSKLLFRVVIVRDYIDKPLLGITYIYLGI